MLPTAAERITLAFPILTIKQYVSMRELGTEAW